MLFTSQLIRIPNIIFNLADGKFFGKLGNAVIDTFAWSGGRGGSKTKNAANPIIVNNPLLTQLKVNDHPKENENAGAIPMGFYQLFLKDPNQENHIFLKPSFNSNRTNMEIHGRGPISSRGCIVPVNFSTVEEIYQFVKHNKHKPPPILQVIAEGDIDYYIRRIKCSAATA